MMLPHRLTGDVGARVGAEAESTQQKTLTIVRINPNPRCGHEAVPGELGAGPTGMEDSEISGLVTSLGDIACRRKSTKCLSRGSSMRRFLV